MKQCLATRILDERDCDTLESPATNVTNFNQWTFDLDLDKYDIDTEYNKMKCVQNDVKTSFFKGAVSWKILRLVLISVEHRIKTDRQSVFSFSITCFFLQIFTVLKYANSLWCHLLTHTKYKLYFTKQEILFKLTRRIYSNFTRV